MLDFSSGSDRATAPATGTTETPTAEAPVEAPTATFNDAHVWGDLDTGMLDREVAFAFSKKGRATLPGQWKNATMPFGEFLAQTVTKHAEGAKDGFSFLQGSVVNGKRTANAVTDLDMLVLDLDTGESIEKVRAKLQELGLFGVIYTTHSHMKDTTEVKRDTIVKWLEEAGIKVDGEPTASDIARYLHEVKRYQKDILLGAVSKGKEHREEGVVVILKHKPMPKFRVALLLKERFVIADRGGLQREAVNEWKERYAGVSRLLGTFYDRACVDPSRLFYGPRHPKGGQYEIHIVAGAPLDLDRVERVPLGSKAADSVWADAGADMARHAYKTDNMMHFWAKYGDAFDIADFILEVDPDGDRGPAPGKSGRIHRCPNDDAHSNAGDEDDVAFFVVNAADGTTAVATCRHDSCAHLDRVNFTDMICERVGITDALELKKWCAEIVEEDEDRTTVRGWKEPAGFEMTDKELTRWVQKRKDGKPDGEPFPVRVSDPFAIVGAVADADGRNPGVLLQWRAGEHGTVRHLLPREMLHEPSSKVAAALEREGLRCGTGKNAGDALKEYLAESIPDRKLLGVGRSGWHSTTNSGSLFVLPDGSSFGSAAGNVYLRSPNSRAMWAQRGALADWREQIAAYAVGNDRLAFAISAALCGPLLQIVGDQSGGFHIKGDSQTGKSAMLSSAASVWGLGSVKGGQVRSWRATDNALESVAEECSDTLLVLDEMGQADSRAVAEVIYMLANEAGKSRSSANGNLRRGKDWRVLLLSSGEVTLAEKAAEASKKIKTGLDVRLPTIPADGGCGLGVYQTLHSFSSGVALSDHLKAAATEVYGVAGRAFVNALSSRVAADEAALRDEVDASRQVFLKEAAVGAAVGQVQSVAKRFALAAAAGELAARWGVLPWPEGEATRSTLGCFRAWLTERGGTGAGEHDKMLEQIRHFIALHGASRFAELEEEGGKWVLSDIDRATHNRAGYWRDHPERGREYLVFPPVWRADVCQGFSNRDALKLLLGKELILPGDGQSPFMPKASVEGERPRFVILRGAILEG